MKIVHKENWKTEQQNGSYKQSGVHSTIWIELICILKIVNRNIHVDDCRCINRTFGL